MYRSRLLASAVLPMILLAAGCQSTGTGGSPHAAYRTVVSTPGNGGPVVFLIPTDGGKKPEAVSATNTPVCEGCRAEADRYFRTGTMAANCPACNASLVAVNGR